MELNGVNYLIPVDARLETDRDVQFEALPLDQVLPRRERPQAAHLLLDACRENPFAARCAAHRLALDRTRPRPGRADGGTLVAYAAKHGEVALDGDGGNSRSSPPWCATSNARIEINKLFRLVRDDVLAATGRKQEPFVYGSLPGEDFYFAAPMAKNGVKHVKDSRPHPEERALARVSKDGREQSKSAIADFERL